MTAGQARRKRVLHRIATRPEIMPTCARSTRGHTRTRENAMKLEGGCYCRKVRYVAEGEPMLKAQCHSRECQYISGGSPNMFMLTPIDGFSYTSGTPKQFQRGDLEGAVTREFCAECGSHMITRRPGFPAAILKIGTPDEPSLFGSPQMAIYTVDKQDFHMIPEGLPCLEGWQQR